MLELGAEIKEQDQVLWLAERLFQMHVLKVGIGTVTQSSINVFEECFKAAGEFYKYAQSVENQEAKK